MPKFFSILMGAVATALIFVDSVSAQTVRRGEDRLVQFSSVEAAEQWAQFTANRIACDYAMSFTITHSPRKSAESYFDGLIFGASFDGKVFTRILVRPRGAEKWTADFLLQDSPQGACVWKMSADKKFAEVPPADWEKPLLDGLVYSPFDILSPYKRWNATYDGAGRIGQAVHFYLLTNPSSSSSSSEDGSVRIALSREFNSPIRVERLSSDRRVVRTLSLGEVSKTDGLWLMLEASLRCEATRDRDILRFRSAKLRAKFSKKIFSSDFPETNPEPPAMDIL